MLLRWHTSFAFALSDLSRAAIVALSDFLVRKPTAGDFLIPVLRNAD